VQKTEGTEGDSARKEAVKGKLEDDVEGRNALIEGGEAAFFWAAWRQASRSTRIGER
jgi:hypothetical protein